MDSVDMRVEARIEAARVRVRDQRRIRQEMQRRRDHGKALRHARVLARA